MESAEGLVHACNYIKQSNQRVNKHWVCQGFKPGINSFHISCMTQIFTALVLCTKDWKQSLKTTATQWTIQRVDVADACCYESIWWIFSRQIHAIQFHLQYAYFPASGLRPNRIISLVGSLSINWRQQISCGLPVICGFSLLSACPDVEPPWGQALSSLCFTGESCDDREMY